MQSILRMGKSHNDDASMSRSEIDSQALDIAIRKSDPNPPTNKELAEEYGVCEMTISRRIKRGRELLQEMRQSLVESNKLATSDNGSSSSLLLPGNNPFAAIEDVMVITRSGATAGIAMGSALDSVVKGFTSKDIPEQDALNMAVKGTTFLISTIWGAYRSYDKLVEESNKRSEM